MTGRAMTTAELDDAEAEERAADELTELIASGLMGSRDLARKILGAGYRKEVPGGE